jgi:ribosomal-protein-alanine N-acetyltransferase
MDGIIRKAVLADAGAMAELDRLCFTVPWSRQAFEQELSANEAAFYLVAVLAGEIIGYAGLWAILDEGHITNVAVHPAHRRKGLGKILLAELIRISESHGIHSHTLEVRVSNEAAIGLYKKFGFKVVGRRKEYYPDNLEDALILWRAGEDPSDLSPDVE